MTTVLPILLESRSSQVAIVSPCATDLRIIKEWVAGKKKSQHTQRAFLLEAKRWLAWLIWMQQNNQLVVHGSFLGSARYTEGVSYLHYLDIADKPQFAPQLLEMVELTRQPFADRKVTEEVDGVEVVLPSLELSKQTKQRAISVLKAMYEDLQVQRPETITHHPFARLKISSTFTGNAGRSGALRSSDRMYMDYALVWMGIEASPSLYHQCRWVWNALKFTALRRSEFASHRVSDMVPNEDRDGKKFWSLNVRGKGDTNKEISLSDEFMSEFAVYRAFHGLSAKPTYQPSGERENTPLVLPLRKANKQSDLIGDQAIYRYMKLLLGKAEEIAELDGDHESVLRLRKFAAHSARHTCITMIVDVTGDITLAQQMARHASINTTNGYVEKDLTRLARAVNGLYDK